MNTLRHIMCVVAVTSLAASITVAQQDDPAAKAAEDPSQSTSEVQDPGTTQDDPKSEETEAAKPAQDDDTADPPKEEQAAETATDSDTAGDAPPSLDELLGIGDEDPTEATDDPTAEGLPDIRDELDDTTEEEQGISGLFLSAVSSMDDSAMRLNDMQDPGLVTQRLQEDAIRKLDELIKAAEQQQQQQGQPQPQQQDGQQAPQSPEDGQQSQQTQANGQSNSDNQGMDTRPGMQEGDLDRTIDETRAEWGNLPQRVRDMLMQGRGDASASLYRRLTERYYERLAEESSENNPR